jgi:hypothetical protein
MEKVPLFKVLSGMTSCSGQTAKLCAHYSFSSDLDALFGVGLVIDEGRSKVRQVSWLADTRELTNFWMQIAAKLTWLCIAESTSLMRAIQGWFHSPLGYVQAHFH